MPERDGYIPGVPCWVDASVPEPEAVLGFYRDLFGWEFESRAQTGDPEASTTSRGLRGGDVAAVGSIPDGRAADSDVEHLHRGRRAPTRRPARSATPAARWPWSRSTSRARGGWPSSPTPRARRSAFGRRASTRAQRR